MITANTLFWAAYLGAVAVGAVLALAVGGVVLYAIWRQWCKSL